MTKETTTDYGRLIVGQREELFAKAVELAVSRQGKTAKPFFSLALTGGSTPQEWYRWCVAGRKLPEEFLRTAHFTVSDERCVPLHSDQSNFGNAQRQLLEPLNVAPAQHHPWPVEKLPTEAAAAYARDWHERAGEGRTYDVCFLGMGDDGHTASIFPGSELLKVESGRLFTAIDVPGKGWRLTITPTGLAACGLIVIMTLGSAKAAMLKRIFTGAHDPVQTPVQLMRTWRERVVWLVDDAAAAGV
jgi:6-phosphogluconolactonase